MNQKVLFAGAIAIVVIGVLLSIGFSTIGNITLASNSEKPLRIGWMTSWTEPGLVVEALKNTDILARNNAIIETPSFSYGPAIVEATLSNKVDAPLLGSLPAINILANSDNFTTVGRLADFEQFIIVGKDSEISSVFDLKGKKIGVPFATGPHLSLLRDLEKKRINPEKDLELVNIKPADLPLALESKQVDAISWVEPISATMKETGNTKTIATYTDACLILLPKSYIKENPQGTRNFLNALKEASFFVAQNKKQTFEWFSKDSSFSTKMIESLSLIEPNYEAKNLSDIDLSISPALIKDFQERIDFAYSKGLINKRVDFASTIDQSFLK